MFHTFEASKRYLSIDTNSNNLILIKKHHSDTRVMSDPAGGMTYVSDPKKHVGGHVVAHASNTRVMFRKGRDNERIAKLIDSPSMPEAEARFLITEGGVNDSD